MKDLDIDTHTKQILSNQQRLYEKPYGNVNIDLLISLGFYWYFICGGRGTGKTVTALKWMIENKKKFIFMRRAQTQCDAVNNPLLSPIKKVNKILHTNYIPVKVGENSGAFYDSVEDDREGHEGERRPIGEPISINLALKTLHNLNGFDANEIEWLIYDEFVPRPDESEIQNECETFMNAYETINRNRELEGIEPLKVLFLGNSDNVANDFFMQFNMSLIAMRIKNKRPSYWINDTKDMLLVMLEDSPLSKKKRENTLISRISKGTRFNEVAMSNNWVMESINDGQKNLKEYKPVLQVGELFVYFHKSNGRHYVSDKKCGAFNKKFDTDKVSLERFIKQYKLGLYTQFINDRIDYADYAVYFLFCKYLNIKR